MNIHRMDPGMLWQSYRAAMTRNEYETATDRLYAYLQHCTTREDMMPAGLPESMVRAQEYKLYGINLLSKAFDEYASHGWSLSHQPVDMLTNLKQYHMSSITEQIKASSNDAEVCKRAITLIQYLCGLISSASNYTAIVNNGVTSSVINLAKCCLQMVMSCDATNCTDLLTIITYSIIYLHLFYDPNRRWKSQFVQNLSNQSTANVKVSPLDASLPDFFIRLFDSVGRDAENKVSDDMKMIQCELLHMFGAVMSSSKRNARLILNGKTSALLFTLFRHTPTIQRAPLTSTVQAIGARIVVRAVITAHNWRSQLANLEEPVTVDVHVLLYGLLHSLDPRKDKNATITPLYPTDVIQTCLLLDTIVMIITDYRNCSRSRLQEQFINAKCFTNIMSSMATITEASSNEENKFEQLCSSYLKALTAILKNNKKAKDVFAGVVGYKQLAKAIQKLCPINQTILEEFLSMSFDGYTAEQMVYNAEVMVALCECFFCLSPSNQLWLLERLLDIIKKYVHNRQICCHGGLIGHLLSLLGQHHSGEQQLNNESTAKLIELLEVLVGHSISSVELKSFLRLLAPNKNQQLPGYAHMMQRTLVNVAVKDTHNLPLHSIDLNAAESEIKLEKPLNMKTVGSGFTFHAWVYLAPPLSLEAPGALRKRMLYYFGASNGAGFQAFFRNSGTLVIATVTKKREFINLCLQDCPLTHSSWHSICIVHTVAHRLWGHSEVDVYIDGRLIRTEKMKGPESQEYPVGYIGCGPPINGENEEELFYNITGDMHEFDEAESAVYGLNISMALPVETKSVEAAKEQYGVEGILRGFLCSACLFSECLSAPMIASIVDKGPNDLSLFQPKKANSLYEVAGKLMFYYHAKGCYHKRCPDLSPWHIPVSTLDASIHAPVYSSWEVKSVLRSLGGTKLLIPLLENTSLLSDETDKLGVTLFLQLLCAFLDEDNQNLFLLNNGIAIVGALMEEVPADKLTTNALNAVQSLLELAESSSSVHKNFVTDIYEHLIFNFYIWSRADYTVQSGHVQFVSTIVKDNLSLCSKDFGVQFMLNTIQSFYCTDHKEYNCLNDEQQKSIAAALYSNIKLYLQKSIKSEDVKALLAAVLSTDSFDVQEEILRLMLLILKTSDHASVLGHFLMSEGTPLLALLHSHSNAVSQTMTNIMLSLYKKYSSNEGRLSASFKNGTFAAAMVQMLHHQNIISSNILLSVLEMCTEKSIENFTDHIVNLDLCMVLLQLLRIADNQVKTTICQQLISLLQLNPAHAVEIAKRPAWEMIFLWLLMTDDTPATTPLNLSNHNDKDVENKDDIDDKKDSFADGFEVVSLPFSTTKTGNGEKTTVSDDKEHLLNTVVELMGLIVWEEAIDVIVTDELYLQHAWCRLFTAVRNFADKHHTIFCSKTLLQKLLQFALRIVHMTCSGDGLNTPNFITIVITMLELFEFYCISYSSHVPRLDDDVCSIELLECYLNLMRSLGLFAGICENVTILRFTLKLLVACLTTDNKQYSAIGASRLEELLQCHGEHLDKTDVCYLLHVLFSILQGASLSGEVELKHYMVLAIKTIFIHSPRTFDTSQLSHLPDPLSNPNFINNFMSYVSQDEWSEYMASSVIPGSIAFWEKQINPLQAKWHDLVKLCGQKLEERDARRLQYVTHQNNKYQEQVLDAFFDKREKVREQFASDCFNHYIHKRNILEQWAEIKHSLTGNHGVWNVDSEVPKQFTLQVDPTENFARMRMRLIPDYTSGKHEDASQIRDEGHVDPMGISHDPIEHSLLREAKALRHNASITSEASEFSVWMDDELLSLARSEENATEKIIKKVDCQFITLVDFTPGMLHITTHNLHFIPEPLTTGVKEFKISVKDIREVHSRRYHLVRSALELFLVDQTNYFFNFLSKKLSTKVYSCITSLHAPNLIYSGIIQPHKLLQASGLTHKWVRHQISNFDYIMQLNTLSGRTYNDLNQYPVFPWVLCDYTSEKIDLDDPKVYRDLSKPLGIINPDFEPMIRERYEEFEDLSGEIEKFHYGTHYSNAAGVMHFLIRLEPFTSQHISLQSGKFDHSDRQFFSISNTWEAISTSMSDVKELIPEFYYLPEFLTNINNFDLGRLQDKSQIDDVILPKWAKDPCDFIHINRQALESDYVSQHLHEWVDLIWGYKQRGEEAVKACNVFYYCTYEGSVDLTSITNEKKRKQLQSMINNFGQTPTQLFFEPHPQRLSLQEARKSLAGKFSVSGQKSALSIFENLKELKAFSIEVNNEPLISVSSPTVKLETIIASGNPEHVLTITNSGLVNKHDWLPFSLSRNKSFTFTLDHNMHLDRSQWQFVGAPFSASIPITDNLFVSSACNNLLVTAGHWDCSFRVHNLVKGKTVRRISHHTDIVTCVALDKPGERLITGSRDTTCAVWQFSSQNHTCSKPLQILYGHNTEIICIDVSVELDTVVSGAKDGVCTIHSLRRGERMHSLEADHESPAKVTHIAISSINGRIVACYQLLQERRQKLTWLHLFTINGKLLKTLELHQIVTGLRVTDNHYITSSMEMKLMFGHLHNLKQVSSLKLQSPVYSLSLTYQSTHLLVGLADGKLVIVTTSSK